MLGSGRVGQWDGFEENKTHQYTITAHHISRVGGRYAHSDMDINRDATAAAHTMIWTSTLTGDWKRSEKKSWSQSSRSSISILKRNLWPGSCHRLIQDRFLWLMTLVNRHVMLRDGIRKISGDDSREHTAKYGSRRT